MSSSWCPVLFLGRHLEPVLFAGPYEMIFLQLLGVVCTFVRLPELDADRSDAGPAHEENNRSETKKNPWHVSFSHPSETSGVGLGQDAQAVASFWEDKEEVLQSLLMDHQQMSKVALFSEDFLCCAAEVRTFIEYFRSLQRSSPTPSSCSCPCAFSSLQFQSFLFSVRCQLPPSMPQPTMRAIFSVLLSQCENWTWTSQSALLLLVQMWFQSE